VAPRQPSAERAEAAAYTEVANRLLALEEKDQHWDQQVNDLTQRICVQEDAIESLKKRLAVLEGKPSRTSDAERTTLSHRWAWREVSQIGEEFFDLLEKPFKKSAFVEFVKNAEVTSGIAEIPPLEIKGSPETRGFYEKVLTAIKKENSDGPSELYVREILSELAGMFMVLLTERFDDHTPVDEEYVKIGQHLSLTPNGVVKSAPVTGLDDEFGNLQLTSHSIYVRRDGTKCIASFFSTGNVSAVGVGDTPDAAVVACKLHVLAKESSKLPHLRQAGAVELNETSQTTPEITSVESSEVAAPTDEIDAASRVRVNSFLKRTRRSCEVTVDAGDVPMQFKAQLPILLHGRHVVAVGVASTKKDAEAACYVHAERIIDAAGVPMFNLPGLQKRHVERATAAGRWAPLLPADGIPHFLVPPPVCVRGTSDQCAPRVPTESSDWIEYTGECERFIEEQHLFELNHGEGTEIPVSCDHLVDATYELVRQLPIGKSVKSRLMNYCSVMNIDYPTRWTTKVVGTLKQWRVMTETTVPGFEHITARGIGPNKDDAQRRASMHCMELLRCLDPDWSLFAETEAHGPGKRSKRDFGSFDHLQRSFTDEGKQRLVRVFVTPRRKAQAEAAARRARLPASAAGASGSNAMELSHACGGRRHEYKVWWDNPDGGEQVTNFQPLTTDTEWRFIASAK
jgi:hypothetical protein